MSTEQSLRVKHTLQWAADSVPGLQVVVVTADEVLLDYASGFADVQAQRPMTSATPLMAYSMTKTVTAIAMLQLVERGLLQLTDEVAYLLPAEIPFTGEITLQQLLNHTSGLPNPVPLRWVHTLDTAEAFDERRALSAVLKRHARDAVAPGTRHRYSNIGYWLLGMVIERATGRSFEEYVADHIVAPLQLQAADMACRMPAAAGVAGGYVHRFSALHVVGRLLTDSQFWGGHEGAWTRVRDHRVNGAAFGGLLGSARAFARLLQDQLRPSSVLLAANARALLLTPQFTADAKPIPMNLAWHLGKASGEDILFKEGGGAGFHCEMRLYPERGVGAVAMANSAGFHPRPLLDELCEALR